MRAAVARRDESIPCLLGALEYAASRAEEVPDDYLLHEYALRILAVFRETRAHEPLIRLARHPFADEILGDTITTELGPAIAATSGGNTERIRELIEDVNVDDFVRSAALCALGVLCREGQLTRQELSAYAGGLFGPGLDEGDGFFGTALGDLCVQFGFTEHLEKVRSALDDGTIDPLFDDWSHMEARLRSGSFDESEESGWRMIDDPAEQMAHWYCFTPAAAIDEEIAAEDEIDAGIEDTEILPPWEEELLPFGMSELPSPVVSEPKPGRNAPCPCGSGKKYKKCCG